MKTANELATEAVAKLPQNGTSKSQTTSDLLPPEAPRKWVAALFEKFSLMYGNSWTSQLPTQQRVDAMLDEWGRQLAGFSGEQIKRGIDSLDGDFPPSLPAFKKRCLTLPTHNTAAYKPFTKALPRPRKKDIGRKAISDLKAKISVNEPKNDNAVLTMPADEEYFEGKQPYQERRKRWEIDSQGNVGITL